MVPRTPRMDAGIVAAMADDIANVFAQPLLNALHHHVPDHLAGDADLWPPS